MSAIEISHQLSRLRAILGSKRLPLKQYIAGKRSRQRRHGDVAGAALPQIRVVALSGCAGH